MHHSGLLTMLTVVVITTVGCQRIDHSARQQAAEVESTSEQAVARQAEPSRSDDNTTVKDTENEGSATGEPRQLVDERTTPMEHLKANDASKRAALSDQRGPATTPKKSMMTSSNESSTDDHSEKLMTGEGTPSRGEKNATMDAGSVGQVEDSSLKSNDSNRTLSTVDKSSPKQLEDRPKSSIAAATHEDGSSGESDTHEKKRQAFLGIRHDLSAKSAKIGYVHANGPAEKAGLKVGDIILAVDGQLVPDVDRLAEVVSNQQPGASVSCLILRSGEQVVLPVELGGR